MSTLVHFVLAKHTYTLRQEKMESDYGKQYPIQRKIQGRCSATKTVHGGLPYENDESQRRRSSTVLCRK